MNTDARPSRRVARRLAIVAAVALVLLATLAVVVHTPSVRVFVLRNAIQTIQEQYGILLRAERLDYNLATLRIDLHGVRLSAAGDEVPFFEAARLSAVLPRRALLGDLAFQRVEVDRGLVRVLRRNDGLMNLPVRSAATDGEPPPLDLGELEAPGVAVEILDETANLSVRAPGITVILAAAGGRIGLTAPAEIRVGEDVRTRLTRLDGGLSFDGRDLRLADVQVGGDEGALGLDGVLSLLREEPSLALTVSGDIDIARAARWSLDESSAPQGRAMVRGDVTGPMSGPIASVAVTSDGVTWAGVAASAIAARARVTPDALDVQESGFTIGGGRVEASTWVSFDPAVDARVSASWSNVILGALLPLSPAAVAPAGTSSGRLTARGPLGEAARWDADVRVRVDAASNSRGRLSVPGESHLRLEQGSWQLEARHRVAAAAPLSAALRGSLRDGGLAASTVAGTVSLAETDVNALVGALRTVGWIDPTEVVVPAGVIRTDAVVTGTLGDPRISFTGSSESLQVAQETLTRVAASGRFATNRLTLDAVSALQPDTVSREGRLHGTGEYDVQRNEYKISASVDDWRLVPRDDRPVAGVLSASIDIAGTPLRRQGQVHLEVRDTAARDIELGDVWVDVQLEGDAARIDARAPDFNVIAAGDIRLTTPYETTIAVTADRLELARALRGIVMPTPITGTADIRVEAAGSLSAWRAGRAAFTIGALDARAGNLPFRAIEPVRGRYAFERVHLDRLEVLAGDARLSASGSLAASDTASPPTDADPLLMTLTGDLDALVRGIGASGLTRVPVDSGSGPAALLARVTGSVLAPVVAADLELGPGRVVLRQDLPPVTDLRVRARVDNGIVELREAAASYAGASVTAYGNAPLRMFNESAPAADRETVPQFHAFALGITPEVLQPFVDRATLEQVAGSIDVDVHITSPSLDVDDVTGELRMSRMEIAIAGLPITQRAPTVVEIGNGFARVESWDWAGEGATLTVRGQVRLRDREAAILADGDVDLRLASPFVRTFGLSLAGRLAPHLSLTGALERPRLDGSLVLSAGELRMNAPRVLVSDLSARAVVSGSRGYLTSLTGAANGGPMQATGDVMYSPANGVEVRLSGDVAGMALEFPAGLRTELDAGLTLALTSGVEQRVPSGRLEGTVTVRRGAYREPLAVVAGLLANLRTQAFTTAASTAAAAPGAADAIELDVRILTDDDIVVDNNIARVQMGADLRAIGTIARPVLSGRAELREGGQLSLGRNVYTLQGPGVFDFANPAAIDPEMNITATTRAGGLDIEVRLSGTPSNPNAPALSAEGSGLGDADLASLLLTGRTLDELSTDESAAIGAQVLGNLSPEVLGFAGRAVGLDTVRLGGLTSSDVRRDSSAVAADIDPTSRLTFGKSLGRQLDVAYSQSLRDGDAQTWIVDFTPVRRLSLRLVSGDDDLRAYEFRHELTVGGPPRQAASVEGRAEARIEVSSIAFSGDLAFPEQQLRRELQLDPGNRFDFIRWQADRDRLQRFYARNQRLAARVSALRTDAPGGVALTYEIAAGPETRIFITGADVGPATVALIEAEWSQSVFDGFLLDEAAAIVRRALADQGYLRPSVNASLIEQDALRTLTVAVDAGARSLRTEVRFDGVDEPLRTALISLIGGTDLESRASVDPGAVERDVAAYLRQDGYMRARVAAGPLREEGTTAILPVAIDAGPQFSIGAITLEGASALAAERVRDALGVTEGSLHDATAIERGRTDVLALYRGEGFPSAAVTVQQHVRADPVIDLVVLVDEGARQVIGDLQVAGNRGTDADVVTRALGLEMGMPLRTADWLEARRRVFDTGLFRRADVAAEPLEAPVTGQTQPMRVRVTVEEWPTLRLRYGFQLSEERPETEVKGRDLVPGLSADVFRRTLFGRATTFGGAIRLQRREQSGRIFLRAPTMMGLPIQSSINLERSREEFAAVTLLTERSGVSWEQSTRRGPFSLSYAYRFERNHTFDTAPPGVGDFVPFDNISINLARLTAVGSWDTRNDPIDTVRGSLFSSTFEYAPEALGSDIRFIKHLAQGYHFHPWRSVVFASAARFGVVVPLAGQELILSERFFAGGARTVRGVSEDSLGERDFLDQPVGGEGLLILNQEVRVPIYRWVRGVGFIDAGNVFTKFGDLSLRELTGAIGVGVRFVTPIALLRVDYGKVVWGGSGNRWVFGIGQSF